MKKLKDILLFLIAFFIPIGIVCLGYKAVQAYPFGEKSLLSMDLWGQYYPMIKAQFNDINNLSFSNWSWDGGLGFNLYAQGMYYTNSIFYKALSFVSSDNLLEALNIMLILKYGFSSLAFMIFLKYKFKSINILSPVFSSAYALSSYAVAYINQPMWTDCIILLPLIIIGLERLINENKNVFYTIILAFTMYVNFYIAFSICIFLILYFFVIVFSEKRSKDEIIKTGLRFSAHSVLAAGLVAFSLLSICMALQNRVPEENTIGELKMYHSAAEIARSMFVYTKLSYEYFVPNIYSGFFVLAFIGIFMGSENIKVRKRVAYAVLIVVLIVSFNHRLLDYIWHGFHFPNQLPGRWTFIFSFVLISMAYEASQEIKKLNIIQVIASFAAAGLVYLLGTRASLSSAENASASLEITSSFAIAYVVITVISFAFVIISKIGSNSLDWLKTSSQKREEKRNRKKSLKSLIPYTAYIGYIPFFICIVLEMTLNTSYSFKDGVKLSNLEQMYFFDGSMEEIRENVLDKDNDFYRVEMNPSYTFNSGLLFDYRGIAYYSSTMNGNVYNLLKSLGNRVYAKNVSSVYNPSVNFSNSIFGVKYIIDRNRDIKTDSLELKQKGDNYVLLENKTVLPLAFPVQSELKSWNEKSVGPCQLQNEFVQKALGTDEEVYYQVMPKQFNVDNADLINSDSWDSNYYSRKDKNSPVSFNYSFVCEKTAPHYIQHNFMAGDVVIKVNGNDKCKITASEPLKYLGTLNAGDVVDVSIETNGYNYALYNLELFSYDDQKFEELSKQLKNGGLEISEFKNDKISGTVTAQKDNQLFYTSVPDEGGWSVYCDGKKLETERIADTFIAFRTPSGSHNIEFVFKVRGHGIGTVIAVICLAAVIYLNYGKKLSMLNRKKS